MFIVIYTGIWLGVTVLVGTFGFMLGKLQIVDASPLPWVMHRDYAPYCPPDRPDPAGPWPGAPERPDMDRDRTF